MHAVTPCVGNTALFESTEISDHLSAKDLCDACPRLMKCGAELDALLASVNSCGMPDGTWAGRLLGSPARTIEVRSASERARVRLEAEEARFTDQQAREAHRAYCRGERDDPWVVAGNRVFDRRKKRRNRAAREAVAS